MEKPQTKTKNPYPYSIGFKDEITISVKAGNGGNGCVSFLREKFRPKGGPAGGDGGKGGDVIIKTSPHLNTLYHLTHSPWYHAQDGEPGGAKNCSGKNGRDFTIEVPPGTIIRDAIHNNILKDLKETDETAVFAKGGKGGCGNQNFATSTNQSPRYAKPGEPGEERKLYLELKLIADVGLVGFPNAGKSLLIRKLSAAHPKVANYPFTTLDPCLGILKGTQYRTLVIADLPGLIEGAHAGKGLGDKFLKHIERTKIIAHIIDFSSEISPVKLYKIIRKELSMYNPMIAKKSEIVVANKMDMPDAQKNYRKYASKFKTKPIPISALTQTGLEELTKALFKKLR